MSLISVEEEHIKTLFKQAVVEVLEEHQGQFYDLVAEVIEDMALARAMREGEATEEVSREEVFNALEGAHEG